MDNKYNTSLESEKLIEWARGIKHVVIDMDGTIYMGDRLFPFTKPFLDKLHELGLSYSFLTNNSTKLVCDYIEKLSNMGINVSKEQIYTSIPVTIDYIKNNLPEVKKLFVLGTPSMSSEFIRAGFGVTEDDDGDVPDGVVVAFDTTLTYSRLCRAAWWISKEIPYIATNPDNVCPTDKNTILIDCGSICSCLEKATGRKPDRVFGKPDANMLQIIASHKGIRCEEIAMVGDRIYTDVQAAHNAGSMGILVLSGETTLEVAEQSNPRPHLIVKDISELGEFLKQAKQ